MENNKSEQAETDNGTEQELPFLSHLFELRDRLLRVVVVVLLIFLGLFSFANDIYHLLAQPLLNQLPAGQTMIATGVISPFLTPFKLALVASIFLDFFLKLPDSSGNWISSSTHRSVSPWVMC